jgi:phage/plasmid-associated DNA primase
VVKELTGSDPLSCRDLYEKKQTFCLQCVPVLLTNNLPNVGDRGNAIWRRLVSVPFNARFVENPQSLHEKKIDENMEPKFVAWRDVFSTFLVDIQYRKFVESGDDLHIPPAVYEFTAEYRSSTDYIAEFVQECLEMTTLKDDVVTWKHLFEEFLIWFKTQHKNENAPDKTVAAKLFSDKFKQKIDNYSKIKPNVRGFWGVKYKPFIQTNET